MPATIRDIREQTGLSLATISKYLNGGNVLPENRIKIENAIGDLHYEVNEIARGLVTKKTRTVGVVVFSIESLFNGKLLRYIGDTLRKEGYGMLICDSGNDPELEKQNIRFLISKKVDGIIVIPIAYDPKFLEPAKSAGIPVVLLDRYIPDSGCDSVQIDNQDAVKMGIHYLYDRGHRKIAGIGSDAEYTGRERMKGFLSAVSGLKLDIPDNYVKRGRHSFEFGYQSMKELLALKERPTAVFIGNYEMTLGALMAVNETNLRCPDDISMMGLDNLIMAQVVKPRMCMVIQPMEEMGVRAAEMVLRRIESKNADNPEKMILKTNIQEGNSVKTIKSMA